MVIAELRNSVRQAKWRWCELIRQVAGNRGKKRYARKCSAVQAREPNPRNGRTTAVTACECGTEGKAQPRAVPNHVRNQARPQRSSRRGEPSSIVQSVCVTGQRAHEWQTRSARALSTMWRRACCRYAVSKVRGVNNRQGIRTANALQASHKVTHPPTLTPHVAE